ncbi:cytochrome C [Pedobacter psychrophilus]|uniref:Cytochrome C n=1 Tax=Pedobacter psychrophilus TaxID=1826909 RepID=A0A179DH13_9SPHI|nr:cytochrome c [Pedobacter psychrophilus]OAQ40248.1 cytochrome C [Pedobacter psychrophilus]
MKKLIFILGFLLYVGSTNAQFKKGSPSSPSLLKGKAVYTQYCLPCHQADGGGVMNMNPPLIETTYVLGDKTQLINILLKGLNKPIVIDGDKYTNPMPAVSHLSDQQISDVLTYVRNSFGNKASAVSAAEVKAVRAKK